MGIKVAFFDIGDTLGVPRSSPGGQPISLEVFPYVRDALAGLKRNGLRLGVISNTGTIPGATIRQMLAAAGIVEAFEAQLLLFSSDLGITKETPEIFKRAAEKAGVATGECMYVGEDAKERSTAIEAGMAACPHPLLAADVAKGNTLSFAVVTAPAEPQRWHELLRLAGALPLHLAGRGSRTVYAMLSTSATRMLVDAQLDVHRLGAVNLPMISDLYLVRDDVSLRTGFLEPAGQANELLDNSDTADWLLSASIDGLVIAVPAGESIERVHFTRAEHGHTLKLRPDPSLLDLDDRAGAMPVPESFAALAPPTLDDAESEILRSTVTAEAVRKLVDRYAGAEPLGDDHNPPQIISRHVHRTQDNERAAAAAAFELDALPGMSAVLHAFDHEGLRLYNVEASLPGARDEWVLVTAHLDSTAAFDRPYDAENDKAPGADDDASGVAGVIAAARAIAALAEARPPTRGIRFVLFNAEEHGLVGSKAYAREQAARGVAISAVLQMDMIGFNREPPRAFEIHAGFARSPAVERRTLQLASLLAQVAPTVSPDLAPAQVYPAAPGERDPADGRSDHSAFQERGYTACAATEDFFVGPLPDSSEPEGNPQYHRKADTFVDENYAADIARAVAATAWLTAR